MSKKMRSYRLEEHIVTDLLEYGDGKASKGIRNMVRFLKQKTLKKDFKRYIKRENLNE